MKREGWITNPNELKPMQLVVLHNHKTAEEHIRTIQFIELENSQLSFEEEAIYVPFAEIGLAIRQDETTSPYWLSIHD